MGNPEFNVLPKLAVKHYKVVFDFVRKHYGSLKVALSVVGICDKSYRRMMEEDHLLVRHARKIMDVYTKLKQQVAA